MTVDQYSVPESENKVTYILLQNKVHILEETALVNKYPIVGYQLSHHFSFLATESFLYLLCIGMKYDIKRQSSYLVTTREASSEDYLLRSSLGLRNNV